MESVIKCLDWDQVVKRSSHPCVDFKVGRFNNITTKVTPPFFFSYPLQSLK